MVNKNKGKWQEATKARRSKMEDDACEAVRKLLKCYKHYCQLTESSVSKYMVDLMNECMEKKSSLTKLMLYPLPSDVTDQWPVKLEPLFKSVISSYYTSIRDIYLWTYPLSDESVSTLCLFLSIPRYVIRTLELRDCLLSADQMSKLAPIMFNLLHLTSLNLDYNEFGDEGCRILCYHLDYTVSILSLSLCFCALGEKSGGYINHLIDLSTIRDIYLDGNNLGLEGSCSLIKSAVDMHLMKEASKEDDLKQSKECAAAVTKSHEKQGKKSKSKTDKLKQNEPEKISGPYIRILSLVDNGIGLTSFQHQEDIIKCCQLFGLLISLSDYFCELDLRRNPIDNISALCLLEGIEKRAENNLQPFKLQVTHRLDSNIYSQFDLLLNPKKKKGKKK